MIIGDQIRFGSINFLPHPPTLLSTFVNIDRGMDLMLGSFNFRVGSHIALPLSDPICSDPSAAGSEPAATLASSDDSSSEVNAYLIKQH
jgi:hypothetical protein